MSYSPNADDLDEMKVVVELDEEDQLEFISILKNETAPELQSKGYLIQVPEFQSYAHAGHDPILFNHLISLIIEIGTTAWVHHKDILDTVTPLITIFNAAIPIAKALKGRDIKDTSPDSTVKITFEVNEVPITIEAYDLDDAEAAIKLTDRYLKENPPKTAVKLNNKVKIRSNIKHRKARSREFD